ncbi:MAG: hypothetical protein HQL51_02580 [Magnetococcales bacterium]|nr:hypothetical protein [Magnetococcales bacterium]
MRKKARGQILQGGVLLSTGWSGPGWGGIPRPGAPFAAAAPRPRPAETPAPSPEANPEASLRQAILTHPENAEGYLRLAALLASWGQTVEALSLAESALLLDPQYHAARRLLALLLLHAKRPREALDPLCTALEQEPRPHRETLALLAQVADAAGSPVLAAVCRWRNAPPSPDPAALPGDWDLFFLDSAAARREAREARLIPLNLGVFQPRLCFHPGPAQPGDPPQLIAVPPEPQAAADFFLHTRWRRPRAIVFPPADETAFDEAMRWARLLDGAAQGRMKRYPLITHALQQTTPRFEGTGPPWRFFLPTSRHTNVSRYTLENLAQALRRRGHEVWLAMEAREEEKFDAYDWVQQQHACNPHVVLSINRMYNQWLHPEVVLVTWWQDILHPLTARQPIPWRPRDIALSLVPELDPYLRDLGAREIHRLGSCIDPTIFRPPPPDAPPRANRVALVGGSYAHQTMTPATRQLALRLTQRMNQGLPLTREVLQDLAKALDVAWDVAFWQTLHYVVRDVTTRWLCQCRDGVEVEIHGHTWERDPLVRPFHQGIAPHGAAVAQIYQRARYALVPHPFDLQSQRMMEVAACGCIPVVYDCRPLAAPPHWDDHALWFNSPESLRACLGRAPQADPAAIAQGQTYDHAAAVIESVVQKRLEETRGR